MSLEECFVVLLYLKKGRRLAVYNVGSARGALFSGSYEACQNFIEQNRQLESNG